MISLAYCSSSSSTIGNDDWCRNVGEHLEVKATTQLSNSRGESHKKVKVIGVSYPCCLTLNPGSCLSFRFSMLVCLKLMTPNGLQIFFWGYKTAKCSKEVRYTLTLTPCRRPFMAIRVKHPVLISEQTGEGSGFFITDAVVAIITSVGIFF